MAVDYSTILSDTEKAGILKDRIKQFAVAAWQHDLNAQAFTLEGDIEGAEAQASQVVILDERIKFHQAELAKLPTEEV